MNISQMTALTNHYDKYFNQSDCYVVHQNSQINPHIDIFVYPPNGKFPFWKLVTAGASDYKMPKVGKNKLRRNEYMMFVDQHTDLGAPNILKFYADSLLEIAYYPQMEKTYISIFHSIEWGETEDSDMVGAFIDLPQIIEDVGVINCNLHLFKKVTCLQVTLLTKSEIDKLLEIGPEKFSESLYPEDRNLKQHYLSEQYRSEKF